MNPSPFYRARPPGAETTGLRHAYGSPETRLLKITADETPPAIYRHQPAHERPNHHTVHCSVLRGHRQLKVKSAFLAQQAKQRTRATDHPAHMNSGFFRVLAKNDCRRRRFVSRRDGKTACVFCESDHTGYQEALNMSMTGKALPPELYSWYARAPAT